MDFIDNVDRGALERMTPIAESDQFAMYAMGDDTYMLVQRHAAVPWTAFRLSGDGVFRVAGLFSDAMRHIYRNVASQLSPNFTRQ
jgi:hypothetical protein